MFMTDTNSRVGRELPLYRNVTCSACAGKLTFLGRKPGEDRDLWHCMNCGINWAVKRKVIESILTIEKLPKIIQPSKGEI